MRNVFVLLLLMVGCVGIGQELEDETILELRDKYVVDLELKCRIKVQIDVEGMVIPDKEVYVEFSPEGKTRVKGKGLSLLPKRGTVEQFRDLLSTPMQAILMSKQDSRLVYKLVSLDPSADWITADIVIDPEALLIYESVVHTRKHGAFTTVNQYESGDYPSRTEVSFEAQRFNLPLKFIGGEQTAESSREKGEEVRGKVVLEYTYL